MIRALVYLVALPVLTGWHGGLAIWAALAGIRQRPGGIYDRTAYLWGTRLLRLAGLRVEVDHRERLRDDRPCVYVANHVSLIDIWALLHELPGTVRFVFKRELLRVPVLGTALVKAGHIGIHRQNRAAAFAAYDEAARVLRSGVSAIVFAEGTRSRTGQLLPFKKGPFVLAIAAGVPIVPVLVENTFTLLPRGAIIPRRGVARLRVGAEIPTQGLTYEDRDALSARTRDALLALAPREPVE